MEVLGFDWTEEVEVYSCLDVSGLRVGDWRVGEVLIGGCGEFGLAKCEEKFVEIAFGKGFVWFEVGGLGEELLVVKAFDFVVVAMSFWDVRVESGGLERKKKKEERKKGEFEGFHVLRGDFC